MMRMYVYQRSKYNRMTFSHDFALSMSMIVSCDVCVQETHQWLIQFQAPAALYAGSLSRFNKAVEWIITVSHTCDFPALTCQNVHCGKGLLNTCNISSH